MMLTVAALGWINPMLGALLHNGGAIFVVANSARLLAQQEADATPAAGPSAAQPGTHDGVEQEPTQETADALSAS